MTIEAIAWIGAGVAIVCTVGIIAMKRRPKIKTFIFKYWVNPDTKSEKGLQFVELHEDKKAQPHLYETERLSKDYAVTEFQGHMESTFAGTNGATVEYHLWVGTKPPRQYQ